MTLFEAVLLQHLKLARDWVQEYAGQPHDLRCVRRMESGEPCTCTTAMAQQDLIRIDAVIRQAENGGFLPVNPEDEKIVEDLIRSRTDGSPGKKPLPRRG